MRKVLTAMVLVSVLAGMSMALDLTGKTGIGLRASNFSIRHFVNNSFGLDIGVGYSSSTDTSAPADSNASTYSLGGFYAKEIYQNTLFEVGATLQGWQGLYQGTYYNGLSINPFVGGECFINDHVSFDGKVFLGTYGSQMMGPVRTTSLDILSGNLGAHIYF